ncbi:Orf250-like protein [Tiger frog virus]|uniref:Orf250-like protein n=1 Tax=Rana tigrina ranavirus TaxID=160691 RepID=A0A6M8PSV0_RTRV|nr:Orf250-like protein [Tiger frog virus]
MQNPLPEVMSPEHDKCTTTPMSKEANEFISELDKKPGDLAVVSDFVKRNTGKRIPIGKSGDLYVRICDLSGTIYRGETFMLESWRLLYLPKPTRMEVLGTLESCCGIPPFPEYIVLVGEDQCVYAYEDEEIHLFAYSVKQLVEDGIQETGISYTDSDDSSDVDEEDLQQDDEIQKLVKKTREFIDEDAQEFQDFLNFLDARIYRRGHPGISALS